MNRMIFTMMCTSLAVLGLATSPCDAKVVWTENRDAKPLVNLPSFTPIVERLDATVVFISATAEEVSSERGRRPNPFGFPDEFFERFFNQPFPGQPMPPRRSSGSGFVISDDGYVLTNNHVIENAGKIEVKLGTHTPSPDDDETFEAKVVGRDPRTDVALLKIEAKKKLRFAALGNSDEIRKGDWVLAFGNPFGLEHSVSVGIVSAKEREISPNENRRFDEFIQTDAAINFGNSGGPLVNLAGEVIGINTAITAQGSGIGFAVPINLVKRLLPQLVATGSVSRGYLGVMITDITEDMQEALGLRSTEGVLVNDIAPDGPAANSALRRGDVVLRIDGEKTSDARSLQRIVGSKQPGESVDLEVLREGQRVKLSIKLGALDKAEEDAMPQPSGEMPTDKLGLAVRSASDGSVEIEDMSPESPAFRSGALPGDKIRQISFRGKRYRIEKISDYQNLVEKMKPNDSVMLSLEREQGSAKTQLFIAFRVPKTDK